MKIKVCKLFVLTLPELCNFSSPAQKYQQELRRIYNQEYRIAWNTKQYQTIQISCDFHELMSVKYTWFIQEFGNWDLGLFFDF